MTHDAPARVALAEQALRRAQANAVQAHRQYATAVADAQRDLAEALRGMQDPR